MYKSKFSIELHCTSLMPVLRLQPFIWEKTTASHSWPSRKPHSSTSERAEASGEGRVTARESCSSARDGLWCGTSLRAYAR